MAARTCTKIDLHIDIMCVYSDDLCILLKMSISCQQSLI